MMIRNRTKEDLINEITTRMDLVLSNRKAIVEFKEHLAKYGITGGEVEGLFSEPELLEEIDERELVLFTEQMYQKTGVEDLNPENWYTVHEIKTAKTYDKRIYNEVDMFMDIEFENVTMIDDKVYTTAIDIGKISELYDAQMLYYDFNIQRQSRKRGINRVATVYKKNVREIKDKILKRKLKPTTIVFNATVGTSDSGEELFYDHKRRTLRINPDVRLAILDGYHRILGGIEAHKANPDLKFNFILEVTNYTTREAQEFQADHAKATPIPKTRIEMFEKRRHADDVTQVLMAESELKDRVSEQSTIAPTTGEIVSYSVLTDAIEREFPMEFRRDIEPVAKFLSNFFDELIAEYADEFVYKSKDNSSLMNYNKMFAGYVALAAKMYKEDIGISKLKEILDSVDFSRSNPEWEKIGITDKDGLIVKEVDEREIGNYFKKLII